MGNRRQPHKLLEALGPGIPRHLGKGNAGNVPGMDRERARDRPFGCSGALPRGGKETKGEVSCKGGKEREGQGGSQGQGPPLGQPPVNAHGDMVRAGPGLSGLSSLRKPDCAR